MKKITVLLVLLCILLSANAAFAMTQKQVDNARQRAQERVDSVKEISYDDLLANADAYYNQTVKVSGHCFYYNNGVALLGVDKGKVFQIKS